MAHLVPFEVDGIIYRASWLAGPPPMIELLSDEDWGGKPASTEDHDLDDDEILIDFEESLLLHRRSLQPVEMGKFAEMILAQ